MTAKKRNPTTRDQCGTVAGWNAHNRASERQCMPCKIAKTNYTREWRHRTGRNKGSYYTADEITAIRDEVPQPALDFINQRSEYVRAARNTVCTDGDADYWRWQGHMEARRQLAERLGYSVPFEPGEQTRKVS
ncbi:hypothetical protein PP634_gp85 [Arthrobacter phage Richie]|uniref:Uncharacterized protein n=1 Tax=Arthrobacter phage Richie TaxID=2419967 RepID=A0A3G2KIV6_9CAUD|nr:hypothetical protein PP634_gp85 [Arthrobacter phage Richie]AYN58911.1 hypothetical protein PBI_RICHIE_85 [Arthrobacter phage Richie]